MCRHRHINKIELRQMDGPWSPEPVVGVESCHVTEARFGFGQGQTSSHFIQSVQIGQKLHIVTVNSGGACRLRDPWQNCVQLVMQQIQDLSKIPNPF